MKIGKGMGVLAERRWKKFQQRSSNMFRSLTERHEKAGQPPMNFTRDEFREWLRGEIGKVCRYCGQTVTVTMVSTDHLIPLGRGGASDKANLAAICSGCNKAKGSWTDAEFSALRLALAELLARFPESNIMGHVLKSLKIANSFRFGSDRRAKEAKAQQV